ncbi:MAG: hypothetical protein N2690_08090, partial [Rhodocyclaceae bacterium]|nr:hypothetical protein [Rhodocyclaceae bacterium]
MDSNDDLFQRLERLNEIGAALSSERDIDRLLVDPDVGLDARVAEVAPTARLEDQESGAENA